LLDKQAGVCTDSLIYYNVLKANLIGTGISLNGFTVASIEPSHFHD
jgi:hypothetical protein